MNKTSFLLVSSLVAFSLLCVSAPFAPCVPDLLSDCPEMIVWHGQEKGPDLPLYLYDARSHQLQPVLSGDIRALTGLQPFGGPGEGTRKKGDVIVAGSDRIAIDAVGLAVLKDLGSNKAIMGKRIFEQEQMARAVDL